MKRVSIITPLEKNFQLDLITGSMLMTRYGTVSVATAIRNAGYETRLFCEISGSKIDWNYIKNSDYVCFSLMSFNSKRGYELTKKVRQITTAPIIYGGSHSSVLPHECAKWADYVIINEGEISVVELLQALDKNKEVDKIDGLCFEKNDKIIFTKKREFIKELDWSADYSLIHGYEQKSVFRQILGLLPGLKPRIQVPVIQTSRGCPRSCSFCFGKRELGNRYRKRRIDAVVAEVTYLVKVLNDYEIMIVDNDFCIDKKFTIEFLEAVNRQGFKRQVKFWMFTRIETSKDREFLRKIKDLGVNTVMLGVESVNDATLHFYNKKQNKEQITKAIDVFQEEGIKVFSFFVLGANTDTKETIRETLKFAAKEARFFLTCFFILYDFPEQQERFGEVQIINDERFIHNDWRFFNSNFVVHYPDKIRPSTLQKEIIRCYKKFYSYKKIFSDIFRGRPESIIYKQGARKLLKTMNQYIKILVEYEKNLYDENDYLIISELEKRKQKVSHVNLV